MKKMLNRRDFLRGAGAGVLAAWQANFLFAGPDSKSRPNVLWILVEDMSQHWGCYGEKTISTPNIDKLAGEGVLFRKAFVTCPVCSPSRSAMITGMYQTSIGAHHHRSSFEGAKNPLPKNMKLLPGYFKEAGYYTVNGGPKKTIYHSAVKESGVKIAKTDYNFVWDPHVYYGDDWSGRGAGQPFFAQIQLPGGKHRGAKVPNPVDPADVKLPPYYPDDPVIREDWAAYLNSVIYLDNQVGQIMKRLEDEGVADSTAVFLWTDHGISHARGKQFLYDEGMMVPLIVRLPGKMKAGTVREDMVNQIDIAATSMAMAGIDVPGYMQGRDFFAEGYKPAEYVFAARDRCDETLDCIRAARSKDYKYIRNLYPDKPYLQSNRYKDGKAIIKKMRKLHSEGKLSAIQDRIFDVPRPTEELYDLQKDPYEINNLAGDEKYADTVEKMRKVLIDWMIETGDLGVVPEPELELLAVKYKTKYDILRHPENKALLGDILKLLEYRRKGESARGKYVKAMNDERSSIRWWAARMLGNAGPGKKKYFAALTSGLSDVSGGVRVECARSLCKAGQPERGLPVLIAELKNDNPVVRHYSAMAFEDIGDMAKPALEQLRKARKDEYEYVRRVTDRIVPKLELSGKAKGKSKK